VANAAIMKIRFKLLLLAVLLLLVNLVFGQDYQIQTLFKVNSHRASGGYGALGNKFTTIRGEYANLAEVYGGWYINHRFLLGIEASASTNDLAVPEVFSTVPGERMSYQYSQFGLMTEYTLWSHRAVHFSFQLMNGAGFTVQYRRNDFEEHEYYWEEESEYPKDTNWFYVAEPGVKLEMNLFRWMRLSPGISYRMTYGSDGLGMSDEDLTDISYNVTLKFGKF
jgi:hypothetical protein